MQHAQSTICALCFAVMLVVAAAAGAAAAASGSLTGSVTKLAVPLDGTKVVVSSADDATYESSTYTASDGTFAFATVPAGELHVNVYDMQGVFLVSATVTVTEGTSVTLALEIPPDGNQ